MSQKNDGRRMAGDGLGKASVRVQTRVAGHALVAIGKPFKEDGWQSQRGLGRAKCECGWLSQVLPSNHARQQEHALHKRLVISKAIP